ncbi:yolk ferritin [Plakobranchus ocellatus]|uniref:Ferritin n=1 Tax=Plakobranchus ocellatus TaxID=259542 RepID=A0AAV4CWB3_9GAST|nr:yolk ferritin [Plakobranchus ocellatus]
MRVVITLLAVCACAAAKDYVETVRQNSYASVEDMVVQQIEKELLASYIYQAYASYFQRADVSLPGFKKFFSDASLEERDHAQQLIDYVNKRGWHAQFDKLDICGFVATGTVNDECESDSSRESWQDGLMAFEDALVIERFVNHRLLELHREADRRKDAHLTHILEHDFLEEQVHAIYDLGNHVTRLRSFAAGKGHNYKLGEYLFDQNLSK